MLDRFLEYQPSRNNQRLLFFKHLNDIIMDLDLTEVCMKSHTGDFTPVNACSCKNGQCFHELKERNEGYDIETNTQHPI